jgi:hypothetical protein
MNNVFSWFTSRNVHPIPELEGLIMAECGNKLAYILNGELKAYAEIDGSLNEHNHTCPKLLRDIVKLMSINQHFIIIFEDRFIKTDLANGYATYPIPNIDKVISTTNPVFYQKGDKLYRPSGECVLDAEYIWMHGGTVFYIKDRELHMLSGPMPKYSYGIKYYDNDHIFVGRNPVCTIICDSGIINVESHVFPIDIESTNLAIVATYPDSRKIYTLCGRTCQAGIRFDGELYRTNTVKSARKI